jgi:hypothetical protein
VDRSPSAPCPVCAQPRMSHWSTSSGKCAVCKRPSRKEGRSYLCDRCFRLSSRGDPRRRKRGWDIDRDVRFHRMCEQWDGRAFRCFYTHLRLSEDRSSPLYPTWEHREPGDASTAVLVGALINHVKSDLTEKEFKRLVIALGSFFSDNQKRVNPNVLPQRPWRPRAQQAPAPPPS